MKEMIEGRLFVGGADEASTAIETGVATTVLDVRVNGLASEPAFTYMHCPIADESDAIAESIQVGVTELKKGLEQGESIYLHCGSGNGRASVMTAAALIELGYAKTSAEAESFILQKNPSAQIRPNMRAALEQLYK